MTVAAIIGERTIAKNVYSTHAATGTPFHDGNRITDYNWSIQMQRC